MKMTKTLSLLAISGLIIFLLAGFFSGCAKSTTGTIPQVSTAQGETPVAPEQNPTGDIPDSQAFITYRPADGQYQIEVPEGWARSSQGSEVSFVDKLDGVKVALGQALSAPTAASAQANEVAALLKSGHAVQVDNVQDVQLPSGPAVLISYNSNSEPDPVTGKQVRLKNNMYLYFHNGRLATLTLRAPLGADNVDQWQRISQSFRWS
jgi:hypothetical protein